VRRRDATFELRKLVIQLVYELGGSIRECVNPAAISIAVICKQDADNQEQKKPRDCHEGRRPRFGTSCGTRLVNLTPTNCESVRATSQSRGALPSLNRFKVK
jgi:hypothetical protein